MSNRRARNRVEHAVIDAAAVALKPIADAAAGKAVMEFLGSAHIDVPESWLKGELLDVQRYSDGSYVVSRLQDQRRDPKTQTIRFDSSWAAQQFVSNWYAPAIGGPHGR